MLRAIRVLCSSSAHTHIFVHSPKLGTVTEYDLGFRLPLFFESSTYPHHMVRCPSFFLFFDIPENISGFARYVVALFVFAPAVIFENLSGTPNVLDSFSLLVWQYRKFATSEPMVRCSRPLLFRHFRKRIWSARMFCTLLPSCYTSSKTRYAGTRCFVLSSLLYLHCILQNQTCEIHMFCALLFLRNDKDQKHMCARFVQEGCVHNRQSMIICSACVGNWKMEDLYRLQPWRPNRLSQ
jgi:hypothetical protein